MFDGIRASPKMKTASSSCFTLAVSCCTCLAVQDEGSKGANRDEVISSFSRLMDFKKKRLLLSLSLNTAVLRTSYHIIRVCMIPCWYLGSLLCFAKEHP